VNVSRVCIGPGEVAGYFAGLKAGLDELNVPCEHFVLMPNKFGYQESDYFLKSTYLQLAQLRGARFSLIRSIGYFLEAFLRLCVFLYAIFRCDVFVFPGSGSFFKFNDLFILKLLKKKIIVVYLGSDARPAYLSGKHLDDLGKPFDHLKAEREVSTQSRRICKVEKYADVIVNHTATGQFFTRNFIRLHMLGMPVNKPHDKPKSREATRAVRIVHAPSRPLAKGSMIFKNAVEELRAEGYEIDLIELVNVPNSVVLKELSNCDFVLDELYSDVPMAMLATEAAIYAKPVIVGGYYAEQYKIDNPACEVPPTLYVLPSEVKEAIRKLIDDESYRLDIGRRAFDFVSKHWSTRTVAENYMRLLEGGDAVRAWECNPLSLSYYWGWGLSQDNWRHQVGSYVAKCGSKALQLEHNVHLKQRVLSEVRNSPI